MPMNAFASGGFSEQDIVFLVTEAGGKLIDRIDLIRNDPSFIDSILENRALDLLQRIMLIETDRVMVTVSPRLLFEVLLRAARKEMAARSFTVERTTLERIPVFDTAQVLDLIRDDALLKYLADMLSSFTRIRSFSRPMRVRKGVWRRVRFNDMDIDSLIRFCETVDEDRRFEFYKRIGDLCLFVLGMFPEYVPADRRASPGGNPYPLFGRWIRSAADYQSEGRRFYELAARHRDSRTAGLDRVFSLLQENFRLAVKPLNFISERYLQFRKGSLFPSSSSD